MVGILIISHGAFGEALIHGASHVLGKRPLNVRQVGVTIHDDPDAIFPQARDLVRELDSGHGVLVLTDMFGGTPSNLAISLLEEGRVEVVAGLNLPMLVKLVRVRKESNLHKCAAAAQDAGRKYINIASQILGD